MKKTAMFIGAIVALALVGNVQAGSVLSTITTADGDGADSFVQLGNATTNYGNSTTLTVKDSSSGTTTRKIYLRFDLGSTPLAGLTNTLLDLIVTGHDNGGSTLQNITVELWGLNDAASGQDWIEGNGGTDNSPAGEIVWNNAPANVTSNNSLTSDATKLASIVVTPSVAIGDTVTISNADSTSADAFLNFIKADTDGVVTLILRRLGGNSANNLSFASKENATYDAPTLTLLVPTPAALPAGLALMALAAGRRRA